MHQLLASILPHCYLNTLFPTNVNKIKCYLFYAKTFFYLLGKKTCNSHFKCRRRCTGIYKFLDEIFKVKKGQWYLQKWSDETAKTILKSSYDLVISFVEFPLQMNEELCMTDIQHEPNPLKKKESALCLQPWPLYWHSHC